MKQGYVPEGMHTTPAEIAARNLYLDKLCERIAPSAREAFETANKETYEAVAKVESMPSIEDVEKFLSAQGLRKEDLIALITYDETESLTANFAALTDRRGKDLAR